MEELTELFPMAKENKPSPSSYQYTITFDIPTTVIAVVVLMFLRLLYHIFSGLLYFWVVGRASWPDDDFDQEEGILIPADYTFSDVLWGLIENNLQAETMVMKQNIDEKRGQKLRDSKHLPTLVNCGCREGVIHYDSECAICLEESVIGEFCQVFSVCSHVFHSKCIDSWLARKLTCPLCRSSVIG